MPVFFALCGVPGSGKTRLRHAIIDAHPEESFFVYSTDDFIHERATETGLSYEAAFRYWITTATDTANSSLQQACRDSKHIVWDQTLYSRRKQQLVHDLVPDDYKSWMVALNHYPAEFASRYGGEDILADRLAERPEQTVPANVLADIKERFEPPWSSPVAWDMTTTIAVSANQDRDVERFVSSLGMFFAQIPSQGGKNGQ